jgi:hypothetical protein
MQPAPHAHLAIRQSVGSAWLGLRYRDSQIRQNKKLEDAVRRNDREQVRHYLSKGAVLTAEAIDHAANCAEPAAMMKLLLGSEMNLSRIEAAIQNSSAQDLANETLKSLRGELEKPLLPLQSLLLLQSRIRGIK